MPSTMRAKMKVTNVQSNVGSERLSFSAVSKSSAYPNDGSDENNTFAKWTPQADLNMTINNPELIGKFQIGAIFYLDFTEVKD